MSSRAAPVPVPEPAPDREPPAGDDEVLVGAGELADWLGDISAQRVRQLVEDRVIERESRGKYRLKSCVKAYVIWQRLKLEGTGKRGGEIDARKRLVGVQADQAELNYQRSRGQLVPHKLIARAWDRVLGMIRQRFLGFADRVAGPVLDALGLGPEHRVKLVSVLSGHAHEVLAEIAGTEVRYDDDVEEPTIHEPGDVPDAPPPAKQRGVRTRRAPTKKARKPRAAAKAHR